jgi:hypothetical protein
MRVDQAIASAWSKGGTWKAAVITLLTAAGFGVAIIAAVVKAIEKGIQLAGTDETSIREILDKPKYKLIPKAIREKVIETVISG